MKKYLILLAAAALAAVAVTAQAVGLDPLQVLGAAQHGIHAAAYPDAALGLAAFAAMGSINMVQEGDIIDWVNGTGNAVASGDVVPIGNILGVAMIDIADGDTGSVAIEGVFVVPKTSGAVIAQGESLTWDVSAGSFDDNAASPATGDVTGPPAFAFESAGNGVTTLKVMFTGVPGTVT